MIFIPTSPFLFVIASIALRRGTRRAPDQYCPRGSNPKTCCPYMADTESQLRLMWELAAWMSRQNRCMG
jgi:hypothetical protein